MAALDGLNLRQREAASLPDGSALIIAGAGTGKTRVLAARIGWLLGEGGVRPGEILSVTFTNKAAREMRERIARMTSADLRPMWVGTFHGLAARFLRIHSDEAGLRADFQILDSQDQLALIKRLLRERDVDPKRIEPAAIRSFINRCKESALRAGAAAAEDGPRGKMFAAIYDDYEKVCARENKTDFAELILRTVETLRDSADLRAHYQARFRHVLIDEFQDANPLQYRWLRLLRGENAFFAVGDDDQSIYAFRGADPAQMQNFIKDFNVADSRVIRLEKNYRSAGNILGAANALIAKNSGRLGKTLATDAAAGAPLTVIRAVSGEDEAARVVGEIARKRDDGHSAAAAVLYRTNAQSRLFERALVQARIPYRVYGGLRFFERREIKEALAYLRLAITPADDDAFLRAVNFPPRGLGARTLEKLRAEAQSAQSSLWRAAQTAAASHGGLAAFVGLMQELRMLRDSLPAIARAAVEKTGLKAHYEARLAERERAENLAELVTAAARFEAEDGGEEWTAADAGGAARLTESKQERAASAAGRADSPAAICPPFTSPPASGGIERGRSEADEAEDGRGEAAEAEERRGGDALAEFLAAAALESGEASGGDPRATVMLMTAHAAKGLEFDDVFIVGLEEGLFPAAQSIDEGALEEERRLLYVALTRARRELFLCGAHSRHLYGNLEYRSPSRFLDEIPASLLRFADEPTATPFVAQDRASGAKRFGAARFGRDPAADEARFGAARFADNPFSPQRAARTATAFAKANQAASGGRLDSDAPADFASGAARPGTMIVHTKFGKGVIIKITGDGENIQYQIAFRNGQTKWLLARLANLRAA